MALGPNLNAIDAERDSRVTAQAAVDAARQTIETSRTSERALMVALEQDIRDANTNGFGSVFSAGFLDDVPDGTVKTFSRNNTTRRLTFDYDKDTDRISNLKYETGTFDNGDI